MKVGKAKDDPRLSSAMSKHKLEIPDLNLRPKTEAKFFGIVPRASSRACSRLGASKIENMP